MRVDRRYCRSFAGAVVHVRTVAVGCRGGLVRGRCREGIRFGCRSGAVLRRGLSVRPEGALVRVRVRGRVPWPPSHPTRNGIFRAGLVGLG